MTNPTTRRLILLASLLAYVLAALVPGRGVVVCIESTGATHVLAGIDAECPCEGPRVACDVRCLDGSCLLPTEDHDHFCTDIPLAPLDDQAEPGAGAAAKTPKPAAGATVARSPGALRPCPQPRISPPGGPPFEGPTRAALRTIVLTI